MRGTTYLKFLALALGYKFRVNYCTPVWATDPPPFPISTG